MRILTFGWDYPPIHNGGLGVACHGLTEELGNAGIEVLFVLPRKQETIGGAVFRFAIGNRDSIRYVEIESNLAPYCNSRSSVEFMLPGGTRVRLSRTILEEVYRYAHVAREIALEEKFDLIHAHDWTAYMAGLFAKEATGKPLVLHVHATSFDQAGGENVDPSIYEIEYHAFHTADCIVAISNYTKNIVVSRYGVDASKVEVIHNGIKPEIPRRLPPVLLELKKQGRKIVLYNGRITIQKGVDYFVRSARRVVDVNQDVMFVISGWGDMEHEIMHLVGALGLSQNVIFAGALWDEDRDRMYQSADLVVMPSVSEPFGLVPLEALLHGTPVIISKQSGVSEVLTHALKVDFWDIEEMANKILSALRYPVMHHQLVVEGQKELTRITWRTAAEKVILLYRRIAHWFASKVR